MMGLGTLANVATILIGSALGLFLGRGMKEKYQTTVMLGIALCVCVIGLKMALKSENMMIDIVSMVLGCVLGEYCQIEDKLTHLGEFLAQKVSRKPQSGQVAGANQTEQDKFVEGFVSTSLIFCVGAMAIVGSLEDGLKGDPSILYAKAIMDGVGTVVFSANLGIGVAFSALSVALYQGSLTLLASFVGPFLTEHVISAVSSVGGLLILAIGINMLGAAKLRIGNMLPAMFIAGVIASIV